MSGGGSRVLKGKMSSTIVQEIDESSMQNLEKQLEKVNNIPLIHPLLHSVYLDSLHTYNDHLCRF